jgi:hypothetical protein
MSLTAHLLAVVACAPLALGHYTFTRLRHNGDWKLPQQYIRGKPLSYLATPLWDTNSFERYHPSPVWYLDEPNSVRCGYANMDYAAETEILTVQAGDSFEIVLVPPSPEQWEEDNWKECPDELGFCWRTSNGDHVAAEILHEGPVVVHLSKVPDGLSVTEYDGSGEWVKIYRVGLEWRPETSPDKPVYWLPQNNMGAPPRFKFEIPVQTPPGEYLMRMDQIRPGLYGSYFLRLAQLYPSCAQLNVISNSTAPLPTGIKLPQDVIHQAPGMYMSSEMDAAQKIDERWQYPGGPLWDGEKLTVDAPIQ